MIGVIVGFILGFLGAVILEWLKAPRLTMQLGDLIVHDNGAYKTVRAAVENRSPDKMFRWFLNRSPALRCTASIRVLDPDGTQLIPPTAGRWTSSQQPPHVLQNNVMTPYAWRELQFLDIYPGPGEDIDIAVRHQGETECYPFTNEAYIHAGWRDPARTIPAGWWIVEVSVRYPQGEVLRRFRLRNDVSYSRFCLEEE